MRVMGLIVQTIFKLLVLLFRGYDAMKCKIGVEERDICYTGVLSKLFGTAQVRIIVSILTRNKKQNTRHKE